jgi:predicted secreted protein
MTRTLSLLIVSDATRAFSRQDDKGSAALTVGQDFTVRLPIQAGTGYTWQVTNLPAAIAQTGDAVEDRGDNQALGRSQDKVFQFKAVSAGAGALVIDYLRPWEKSTAPEDSFRLEVNVAAEQQ